MLISVKYQEIQLFFLGSHLPTMLFFLLINVKMPTIVGILTLMSRKNFMLSRVEHEKSFITLGPGEQNTGFIKMVDKFDMNLTPYRGRVGSNHLHEIIGCGPSLELP